MKMFDPYSDKDLYSISNQQKLLALWSDLQVEHKVQLLENIFSQKKRSYTALLEFRRKMRDLALIDRNDYIRYLGAKEYFKSEEKNDALLKTLRSDSSELVRHCEFEFCKLPQAFEKKFWSWPVSTRLAFTRNELFQYPQYLTGLLQKADKLVKQKTLTYEEVHQIVEEYAAKFFIDEYKHFWEPEIYDAFDPDYYFRVESYHKECWHIVEQYSHFLLLGVFGESVFLKKSPVIVIFIT